MSTAASILPNLLRPDFEAPNARLYLGLWPIAIIELGDAKREHLEALLRAVDEKVIARKQPYVMVTDTRRVTQIPGADVRKAMADWMKKNAEGHTSLGAVTIIKSSIVRGAMTALYWVFEPPNPQGIVGDWAEALRWSLAKFDEAGVPVRPSVRGAIAQPY